MKNGGDYYRKRFGRRERRALLFLLPITASLILLLWGFSRHSSVAQKELGEWKAEGYADSNQIELFDFDPNTVTYEELRLLGIPKSTAAGIVKYRQKGKVFEIVEDFAACYGITDSIYAILKPHIIIGDEYRAKPFAKNSGNGYSGGRYPAPELRTQTANLEPFDPNELDAEGFRRLGFSVRQSEAIINYRRMRGGFRSAAELSECYVISPEKYSELEPYISIAASTDKADTPKADILIELNGADSLTLVGIRGIGAKTASQIIAYRERLGGFHSVSQLAELRVVTESNFELISKQIWVDDYAIQKIDINFASPEELGNHPYMVQKRLRRILKNRQLEGGWRTIEDMVNDKTLSGEEAEILAPYLHFAPLIIE